MTGENPSSGISLFSEVSFPSFEVKTEKKVVWGDAGIIENNLTVLPERPANLPLASEASLRRTRAFTNGVGVWAKPKRGQSPSRKRTGGDRNE